MGLAAKLRFTRPQGMSRASHPPMSTVQLTSRGEHRLRRGHLWVYRSDLKQVDADAGDLVRIVSARSRSIGYGLYSDRSTIALRVLTRDSDRPGTAFWRARLEAAIAYRASLRIDATAYRLVHGEGDLLPGLVVDRYGDALVVQALTQGTDRLLPLVCDLLVDLLRPAGVLARNDPKVRALEGLDRVVELRHGDVPHDIEVRDGTVRLLVDPWDGQKTGLFLDQRENRHAAAGHAVGRALDCFSYTGAFALQMATRCDEVVAIDVSESAVGRSDAHAACNGVPNIRARVGNVFDALRAFDRARERFDTIVLDPPAFAKNRAAVTKAVAGYKEINLRALKIFSRGGTLVTSSCSYHLDEPTFARIVADAAGDAGVDVRVIEKRSQSRDHPVLAGVPETAYLKCFVLRKM